MQFKTPGPANARLGLVTLTAAYILRQFFRSYIAVVAPELVSDLRLSPAEFGEMSSAFFLTFSCAQIPVGLAFDRLGVGRTTAPLLALGATSALTLALAPNFATALVAQIGLGLACSPVFMGLIYFAYERYEHGIAIRATATAGAIGTAGSHLAAAPLGWAAATVGWRGAMGAAAVLTLVACVSTVFFLIDVSPTRKPLDPLTLKTKVQSLLRNSRFLTLVPISLVMSIGGTLRTAWLVRTLRTCMA